MENLYLYATTFNAFLKERKELIRLIVERMERIILEAGFSEEAKKVLDALEFELIPDWEEKVLKVFVSLGDEGLGECVSFRFSETLDLKSDFETGKLKSFRVVLGFIKDDETVQQIDSFTINTFLPRLIELHQKYEKLRQRGEE